MQTIATTLLLALAVGVAVRGAGWLTLRLPGLLPFFDRKPFNCRPCASFHLTWMLIGILALLLQNGWIAAGGMLVAFLVFGVIHYLDNKKIEK